MRNGVQLITYADRFGSGGLQTIVDLLTEQLDGVFTGVHVLPFYTPFDGTDAGFDPVDHRSVDPRLGSWDDLRRLSESHDVMADLIVNHVSDRSHEFRDFLARGDESPFAGMFLDRDTVFPGGATESEVQAIYRPRPGAPFSLVTMADGSNRTMWTTFTPHQIDIDVRNPVAQTYLESVLDRLADSGVSQVRLDAVGYAVKTRGTDCFMTDDTYEFIGATSRSVKNRGMIPLLEIHSHYEDQIEAAQHVDRVYDFALPPLVLHALHTGSARRLRDWLEVSPRNVYTVLDTHDGIGVIDAGPDGNRSGLLSLAEIDELVDAIHNATRGESKLATGEAASNLDLYQINSTYYSALGSDDNLYLLARLIQFLCPGIPQVYYAGLLAASNDVALLERTGVGRSINRPYYTLEDIALELRRPVVRRLLALTKFRSIHRAFDGSFHIDPSHDHELSIRWEADEASVRARIDVASCSFELEATERGSTSTISSWDGFTSLT